MRFGLPRDPAQIAALLAALITLALASRLLRPKPNSRLFLLLAALSAAALSAAYIPLYLRGGPRIIDATSYFLEARALAAGHLAFPLDEPVASTLGRFLVRADGPDGPAAAVIFPPGYPALLALGFLAHAPLAVGPLLAAALTLATYALAERALPEAAPLADRITIPRLATLFSVLCAALRYHTADTMSHGLAALCFTGALAFALSAVRRLEAGERALLPSLGAGFFAGWLAATRPPSALALLLALAFLVVTTRSTTTRAPRADRLASLALLGLGALPGIGLLLAHQHAATGALFTSSQRVYYALSDGPPGCFRYGFGASIGCLGEHGDFVRHNLPHGYGAYAAAATTLRRLKQHLVDAGNIEPFALLVLAGGVLAARARVPRVRLLPVAIALQIAAYVPFYFDGNYPGGGARFYADVLPLEHILAALAVTHLAARASDLRRASRLVAAAVALVPLGFAFRAGFDHALLRDREGGLPMFEPARISHLPARALVFVDTDHGFNLGFDPSSDKGPTIARYRGDALDRFTWEAHERPPAYRYLFPIPPDGEAPPHPPHLVPYSLDLQAPLTLEGENLWPALAQQSAWALPAWATDACAGGRRWLAVSSADPTKESSVSLSLPAPFLAGRRVAPRLALVGAASVTVSLVVDGHASRADARAPAAPASPCVTLPAFLIPPGARSVALTLRLDPLPAGSFVALDRLDLSENESR